MSKIHIPAARVKQGNLVLYATALKVKDLRPPRKFIQDSISYAVVKPNLRRDRPGSIV
jgi:hypothetical protein